MHENFTDVALRSIKPRESKIFEPIPECIGKFGSVDLSYLDAQFFLDLGPESPLVVPR